MPTSQFLNPLGNLLLSGFTVPNIILQDGANPGGIQFPATQVSSSGANTLDDYEEGSWTPSLGGSGGQANQTYSLRAGTYVKVGQLVLAYGRITLSALGTLTGAVWINGLPFTISSAVTNSYGSQAVAYWASLGANKVNVGFITPPGTTRLEIHCAAAAAANSSVMVQADLTDTSDLIFTAAYRASA